jgi:hypothetical protein
VSSARPLVLRAVARRVVVDARAACRVEKDAPTEENLRVGYRTCVLAARALRRASMELPDEEEELILESMLFDELALGLSRQLVR